MIVQYRLFIPQQSQLKKFQPLACPGLEYSRLYRFTDFLCRCGIFTVSLLIKSAAGSKRYAISGQVCRKQNLISAQLVPKRKVPRPPQVSGLGCWRLAKKCYANVDPKRVWFGAIYLKVKATLCNLWHEGEEICLRRSVMFSTMAQCEENICHTPQETSSKALGTSVWSLQILHLLDGLSPCFHYQPTTWTIGCSCQATHSQRENMTLDESFLEFLKGTYPACGT